MLRRALEILFEPTSDARQACAARVLRCASSSGLKRFGVTLRAIDQEARRRSRTRDRLSPRPRPWMATGRPMRTCLSSTFETPALTDTVKLAGTAGEHEPPAREARFKFPRTPTARAPSPSVSSMTRLNDPGQGGSWNMIGGSLLRFTDLRHVDHVPLVGRARRRIAEQRLHSSRPERSGVDETARDVVGDVLATDAARYR